MLPGSERTPAYLEFRLQTTHRSRVNAPVVPRSLFFNISPTGDEGFKRGTQERRDEAGEGEGRARAIFYLYLSSSCGRKRLRPSSRCVVPSVSPRSPERSRKRKRPRRLGGYPYNPRFVTITLVSCATRLAGYAAEAFEFDRRVFNQSRLIRHACTHTDARGAPRVPTPSARRVLVTAIKHDSRYPFFGDPALIVS